MMQAMSRSKRFFVFIAVIAFGGSFGVGYVTGQQSGRTSAAQRGGSSVTEVVHRDAPAPARAEALDFGRYWEIWSLIERDFLRQPVDPSKLLYGSLAGMVESLGDPYSAFFDPSRAALFREDLSGSLEGIGAEIAIRDRQLLIVAPLPETPAARAGLRSGDAILAIDDVPTLDLTLEEAVSNIRGERGTAVQLLIRSKGTEVPRIVSIVRDVIAIESVRVASLQTQSGASVAHLIVTHFNGDTVQRFDEEARQFLARGDDAIVLDFRNNPGGFLESAIDLAGHWAERRVIVREQTNDGRVQEHRSTGLARLQGIPTVVLVNQGTASASEIVAGALQDYGLATIIGEQTFGKGTVQHLTSLPDGSAVKLTIAEWLTPSGRSIEGDGIAPDIAIKLTDEDATAERDPQMDRALRVLNEKLSR